MGYESRVLNTSTVSHVTSENSPRLSPQVENSTRSYHGFRFTKSNRNGLMLAKRLRNRGFVDTFTIKRQRPERT